MPAHATAAAAVAVGAEGVEEEEEEEELALEETMNGAVAATVDFDVAETVVVEVAVRAEQHVGQSHSCWGILVNFGCKQNM